MWAQWLAMAIMTIQQGKGFYPDGTCNAVMSTYDVMYDFLPEFLRA